VVVVVAAVAVAVVVVMSPPRVRRGETGEPRSSSRKSGLLASNEDSESRS
jgi:hypothetical protein